jgi:hypothetical protein
VLLALNNGLPPDAALYQSITAPDELAMSVTVPEPHSEDAVTAGLAGTVFTVANTAVREADKQPLELLRAWA